MLYLEDLVVGARYESASYVMTAEEIMDYARQYDPQPFHTDPEAAKDTFFQGLAASGWHTAGITIRLMVQGGLPIAQGLIGAGAELTWPRPTRAGDTLRVVSEVVQVKPSRSRPERGMVTMRCETLNQRGEVAMLMITPLVVFRRPE